MGIQLELVKPTTGYVSNAEAHSTLPGCTDTTTAFVCLKPPVFEHRRSTPIPVPGSRASISDTKLAKLRHMLFDC